MISFRTGAALAMPRRAAAIIVQRNDNVVGIWHDIDVIKDLCNLIAGYDENSSNMRSVDVPMVVDTFITKPPGLVCIPYEDIIFGEDAGYYFLHLKHGDNGEAVQITDCLLIIESRNASLYQQCRGQG